MSVCLDGSESVGLPYDFISSVLFNDLGWLQPFGYLLHFNGPLCINIQNYIFDAYYCTKIRHWRQWKSYKTWWIIKTIISKQVNVYCFKQIFLYSNSNSRHFFSKFNLYIRMYVFFKQLNEIYLLNLMN